MSPYDTPIALAALTIGLLVLLGAAVIANMRHHKTPTPTRPAAQMPRVGAGPNPLVAHCSAQNCDGIGVAAIHGWWLCTRCYEEISARGESA